MGYVELHCHSAYSFLDGASSPAELAATAAVHGHDALAITDHDGLWGAMEFAHACKGVGVRPITGAEVTVEDPAPDRDPFHLTLLVEDAVGYRNLCRLLTEAHRGTRSSEPGKASGRADEVVTRPEGAARTRPRRDREPLPPTVTLEDVERLAGGLVCLSGCAREGALAGRWDRERNEAEALGPRLLSAFGDRFRVELQRPLWRRDRARNRWLAALAERLGVACVATGDVHAHEPARVPLQDALVAVRLRATLEETEPDRRGNAASVMLTDEEVATRFADHPEAVAESGRLAERLRFDLTSDLEYRYPGSEDPDADRRLAEVCGLRLDERYPGGSERAEAERRLGEELRVIRSLRLSGFFLLHRELLELAREVAREVRGPDSARALLPPGRGRGSSVSSIVCYLTGLSHIDPVRCELFMGRFLNEEINEAPDIDLDFPRDIREKLIPRVHERYGADRSALVAAFATYRSRGAVRDLGKALGLPPGEIERVARSVDIHGGPDSVERELAEAIGSGRAGSVRWRALVRLGREAWGLPRHLSQHPGGMVLSTRPLVDMCPVQPVAMEGRQAVQWDKDSCADAGFLKIDLLGLGMLSAVERCVEEIGRVRGERIDLSRIPLDDPEVYRTIQRAETTGVFQIESRAQMQMLPRSRPENLDDLTVQVALVRPGPIQGGAVHPYLERRKRLREDPSYRIPYDDPCLEPILRDTLGAIVFQDQVIQVAMALAGFSPGEAEGLRRAMSRRRSDAALRAYKERFIEGARARGVAEGVAVRVFEGIQGFSGFGFPKSHAAAFGLLAYQSTWLRARYGPEFLSSLLNEQPMGFYPPDALVHEAQRRGIDVLGPDVNRSGVECATEDGAVRIGLAYVTGLREEDARRVVEERDRGGAYGHLEDLASRSGVGRDTLARLSWARACESLAGSRRPALWRLGAAAGAVGAGDGVQLALPLRMPAAPTLRDQTPWEQVVADYASAGMTLGEHPMALLRGDLAEGVASSVELGRGRDRSPIEVAGMVVARQRPATARGVVFLLLEDEVGTVNVIVPPPVYERHRLVVRTASFVLISGRLERRDGTTNVVAAAVDSLSRPDMPGGEVRHIEPPVERETGRSGGRAAEDGRAALSDLAAAMPAGHSFGRRGR